MKGFCNPHYQRLKFSTNGLRPQEKIRNKIDGGVDFLPKYKKAYKLWGGMKQRCLNPKNKRYKDYGGRGITICERWLKFEHFFEDMGSHPGPNHSIERIDNDGNYEPGNCVWANQKQQSRNTRRNHYITFKGETLCAAEWAERLGISSGALILSRINKLGWPVQKALCQTSA